MIDEKKNKRQLDDLSLKQVDIARISYKRRLDIKETYLGLKGVNFKSDIRKDVQVFNGL